MKTAIYPAIKGMSPQLLVTDLERSILFYTKNLGFQISFNYQDFYCGIAKDGHSIHLKSGKPTTEERENRRNNEHLDITFSIENIEEVYKSIKSKPVTIIQPLRDMPYGREFYVIDPDAYIIAFVEENKFCCPF